MENPTLLENCAKACHCQGGTIWQYLPKLQVSAPANVRRYGKDTYYTYYTRYFIVNGFVVGYWENYASYFGLDHDAIKKGDFSRITPTKCIYPYS